MVCPAILSAAPAKYLVNDIASATSTDRACRNGFPLSNVSRLCTAHVRTSFSDMQMVTILTVTVIDKHYVYVYLQNDIQ